MIEGISDTKFELAKTFFELDIDGKWAFKGIVTATLDPQVIKRIVNIAIEQITAKDLNQINLVVAMDRTDVALAFEMARRLGVKYSYGAQVQSLYVPSDTEEYNALIISTGFNTDYLKTFDELHLSDHPNVKPFAYFAVQRYTGDDLKVNRYNDLPIYSIFTYEDVQKLMQYFLRKKENSAKFTEVVKN